MKWFFAVNEAALTAGASLWEPMILVALQSARQRTSLKPHMIYHGNDDHPFVRKLRDLGVTIILHRVSYLDALEAHYGPASHLAAIASGAFLRTELPLLETEEEVVLYTDCDVMFEGDPCAQLAANAPFACAPEFDQNDYARFNTGVMLMNLPILRQTLREFSDWIKGNVDKCVTFDQDAYRKFYEGQPERLSVDMNWKPYWGRSNEARIVHFHGPKPGWVDRLLLDPSDMEIPDYNHIFSWNPEGYRFYAEQWHAWRKVAEDSVIRHPE